MEGACSTAALSSFLLNPRHERIFFKRRWLSQTIDPSLARGNQSRLDDKPDDWQGFPRCSSARSHCQSLVLSGIALPWQWFRHPLQDCSIQSILPQFGGIDANDLLEDVRSGTLGLCNRTYLVFLYLRRKEFIFYIRADNRSCSFWTKRDMTVSLVIEIIHFFGNDIRRIPY